MARQDLACLYPGFPLSCPSSRVRGSVSSATGSATARSCTFRDKIYGTYRVSTAFAIGYSTTSDRSLETTPRPSAFLLPYSPDLRSCRLLDAFIISSLPHCLDQDFARSTGITPLHRYYRPGRHPLVFHRLPGCRQLYGLTWPISRRDEEGFSSCSACPCHRAAPNTPPE